MPRPDAAISPAAGAAGRSSNHPFNDGAGSQQNARAAGLAEEGEWDDLFPDGGARIGAKNFDDL